MTCYHLDKKRRTKGHSIRFAFPKKFKKDTAHHSDCLSICRARVFVSDFHPLRVGHVFHMMTHFFFKPRCGRYSSK